MPRFCVNCGKPVAEGEAFCANCGARIETIPTADQQAAPPQQAGQNRITPAPDVRIPEEFKRKNEAKSGGAPQYTAPQNAQYTPQYTAPQTSGQNTAQYAAPRYAPLQNAPQDAPKKKRGWIKPVSVIAGLLVIAILLELFVFHLFTGKGDGKKEGTKGETVLGKTLSTESGSVSADNNEVTLCGVTVNVDPMMLRDGERNVTVSVKEDGEDADGSRYESYELEMGEHDEFYVPVEVAFPCKVEEGVDVVVEHYADGEWCPLLSFVDEEAEKVFAYFGSFSPARVSYRPVGMNPSLYGTACEDDENPYMIKVGLMSNYWNVLKRTNPDEYSDELKQFVDDPENYAVESPTLDPDMDAKAAYEAFTKVNTLWTFCDPLINFGIEGLPLARQTKVVKYLSSHSSELSGAVSTIPFIAMSIQVALDIMNTDGNWIESSGYNLYKNLLNSSGTIYSLVTGYGNIGFSLMFLGVALFGMELDYFIDSAKSEKVENVNAVFDAYYTDVEPFDADHWYDVFYDAYWKCDGNADKAMEYVKDAVDEYCAKFWRDVYSETSEDILFAASAAKYRNVFFDATSEQKAALTEQQKAKVWYLIETESMPKIQRFLLERLQENTRKQLAKETEPYNKELTFEIREIADTDNGEIAKYKGCTVTLGGGGIPLDNWHLNIPEDDEYDGGWSLEFNCTVYGYLKSGMVDQVMIYASEEDYKSGAKPIFTKDFTANMEGDRYTVIDVSGGGSLVWARDQVVYYSYYDTTPDVERRNQEESEYWTEERREEYHEKFGIYPLMAFEEPYIIKCELNGDVFTRTTEDKDGDGKTTELEIQPRIVKDAADFDKKYEGTNKPTIFYVYVYLEDGTSETLTYVLGQPKADSKKLADFFPEDPTEGDVVYFITPNSDLGVRYRCVGEKEAQDLKEEHIEANPADYGKELGWK